MVTFGSIIWEVDLWRIFGIQPQMWRIFWMQPEMWRIFGIQPQMWRIFWMQPEMWRIFGIQPQKWRIFEIQPRSDKLDYTETTVSTTNKMTDPTVSLALCIGVVEAQRSLEFVCQNSLVLSRFLTFWFTPRVSLSFCTDFQSLADS